MTDPETGCGHALRFSDVCNPCFRAAEKRAEDAEAGLRSVDAILARRSAIDDEPTREAKILKAIKVAATADDAVRERDEARAEAERLKHDHHAFGRWPDCKHCVSWFNQDEAGSLENSRLREALAESQAREQTMREALENVLQDIEVCDWSCSSCGLDPEFKTTDLAETVRAALAESPAPPDPEATTYHPTAVAVTLTGLIRSHLKNCLRTIKGVDCPDLLRIVDEWANKIARGASPSSPEPEPKERT